MLSEVLENKGNVFNIRQVWILYIDNNQKFSLSFPRRDAGHFPHSEEMGGFFSLNEKKKVIMELTKFCALATVRGSFISFHQGGVPRRALNLFATFFIPSKLVASKI